MDRDSIISNPDQGNVTFGQLETLLAGTTIVKNRGQDSGPYSEKYCARMPYKDRELYVYGVKCTFFAGEQAYKGMKRLSVVTRIRNLFKDPAAFVTLHDGTYVSWDWEGRWHNGQEARAVFQLLKHMYDAQVG